MSTAVLSTLSTEYVRVPVRALVPGQDPTGDTVQLAFMTGIAVPTDDDWIDATWQPAAAAPFYARALIGPAADKQLAAGSYKVWVKFADSPEVPVKPSPGVIIVQ